MAPKIAMVVSGVMVAFTMLLMFSVKVLRIDTIDFGIPQIISDTVLGSVQIKSPFNIAVSSIIIFIIGYLVASSFYLIYLHPLAHLPGPKIAAVSRLYEFYYQVIYNTEFPRKIEQIHMKYGPIVRISPEELSVNDSSFNVDFFSDRKIEKDPWYYTFGYSDAIVAVLDKDLHKKRQTHIMHHFSGTYLHQHAFPIIAQEIARLRQNLEIAVYTTSSIDLTVEFRKLCNEVIRTFLLGDKAWKSDDNDKTARPAQIPLFQAISTMRQFPMLKAVQDVIPASIVANCIPMAGYANEAQIGLQQLIAEYDNCSDADKLRYNGVLFKLIAAEPAYRKNNAAAAMEEFMELLWGGREAISSATTQICFQLLQHPECLLKLQEELTLTKLHVADASYNQLQDLPYLYGVCKEGIRLTWGGSFRMPRILSTPVQYKQYTIPANTPISMSPNFFHQDPEIFESPKEFRPERWLVTGLEKEKLERFWKPFGNGNRGCQGRNLAIEVVWRIIANVFKDFELDWASDCNADDVVKDGTLKVFPPKTAGGLKVKVEKNMRN